MHAVCSRPTVLPSHGSLRSTSSALITTFHFHFSYWKKPPLKEITKKVFKQRVIDYWQQKLRKEVSCLKSLLYFRPEIMSLSRPHPIWTTLRITPYETQKACVQARMLSGRFRTEKLAKHWSPNKDGYCLAPECHQVVENIEHILVSCKALEVKRTKLRSLWLSKAAQSPRLHQLVISVLSSSEEEISGFLLDPSVHPETIRLHQLHGDIIHSDLFYLTRTWCHSLNKERLKNLGRWNIRC